MVCAELSLPTRLPSVSTLKVNFFLVSSLTNVKSAIGAKDISERDLETFFNVLVQMQQNVKILASSKGK